MICRVFRHELPKKVTHLEIYTPFQWLIKKIKESEKGMLTVWGVIRITRFTNEGGGAAGDGASRSGEIGGLVGIFADWFVGFAGFSRSRHWRIANVSRDFGFGSGGFLTLDLTAFVVCFLTIEYG
ncbi:hypothetical protein [Rhizobium sp. SL86]|uniref:hypothetical protein n=1 Tax=Rhizobium sp. SL86 TaxID=2995148 RepID=UPI002276B224|nr:hypothetical protein [Rhizobium sp. SL86]MCY1665487.1 hypothetical protein [Rhizobium sp. SL86]